MSYDQYQEQRLAIARASKRQLGEAYALGDLGNVYFSLRNYPKAIKYYEQSLAIFRTIKNREREGYALLNLGGIYRTLDNYPKAIEYYEQSLAIFREVKDRQGEVYPLNDLARAYSSLGNYPKAIEYYEQQLAIYRELKDRRNEVWSLGRLGDTYRAFDNYPKAIEYYEQQLAIARELKDQIREGNALGNLGDTYYAFGNYPRAEQVLLAAISVYESMRENLEDTEKVNLADRQRFPYNTLQQVFIAQKKIETALEIAERGRARAFAELLAKRTQGKEQITIQPIQIAAIKQIAKAQNATLVEYSNIADKSLYIYVVKPTGEITVRKVDLTPLEEQKTSLDNLITAARCLGDDFCEEKVASRGPQPISFNFAQADRQFIPPANATLKNSHLQQLHTLLIDPIADLLPKNPNDRIIFMPQGQLFLVPFAALQDQQGQYLIDRHTISVAPSIQVLQLTRQQRQKLGNSKQGNMLLVGNPVMPSLIFNPANPPAQLSPLPGAEKEAKAISKMLKVPALIGKQATKAAVMKQMPSARIIHLATHGLLDDFGGGGVPGAIALAPDKPGEVNNGLLTSNELLDLKLNAELVVLSACDTGRGKITGDGVIGLSRSLITAGVPSVIVSLWAVPDSPTADLMTRFYQNLKQGQDKATALRQAMLATKKDHPDPTAWAAFVLIGEAQ
ncbi:MAG: CHAT domain-containing tetratricopeptide repeat protein [Leptolyngbyaceae cyanobacterium bins.59]|nr:CHAT domain-containing tetratricopeptide repeat protein [Leptolyngbyaceae cyanobacterium bins.59]